MSQRVELPTAALTALTELSAVTNDEFDQLPENRIRQQLRTTRDLATSLNGLPALPPISRQGTPAPLEQNPHFQQLPQRVQNLTNEREALAEERDALTEERDALLTEGQGLEARYRAIETDLERDRATIVTLNTALTNTNTALATATAALANAGGPAPPAGDRPPKRESIPKPQEFDGSQDQLRPFIAQLRTKFLGDAHKFVDVQHRLAYAVGFLKGKAYEQILPLINEGNINIASVEALITLLENAFGDPDRVRTAERNLQNLRQKNRNFSDYLADFQRYAAEVSWNDAAKRTSLYEGLSTELKDALVTLDTPDELDQYIILLKRVDNKIRARAAERKGSSSTWRSPTTTTTTTPKPAAPPTTTTTATGTQAGPMDLSAGRRRLSQAQREDRMRRGQCFYCGGANHMARQCPNRQSHLRANAAAIRAPPPVVPEDSRPESEHSEN